MKTVTQQKQQKRVRRHDRIRAKVGGTAARPRLAVFRSNRYVSGQLIDDVAGKTLVGVSTRQAKGKGTQSEQAFAAGKELAAAAGKQGVKEAVFDRGGFMYMGLVKAFADGAREGGLTF